MFRFEDHHHWGGFCVTRDLASPSPQMTEQWQGEKGGGERGLGGGE